MVENLVHALELAGIMGWDILWGLNLGFLIAAVVDTAISKNEMARLLPDTSARSIGKSMGLGAASSSCSYAAVAMARSIFRSGGDFIAAMVFQFAATNLVIELGILLAVIIGWQFTLAEFVGGPLMIAFMVLILRRVLTRKSIEDARTQAKRGLRGSMEGHAAMAMGKKSGSIRQRIFSTEGLTSISHNFVMNWQMLWKDIVGGLLIAGAVGAWVPHDFWTTFFLGGHGGLTTVWGAFIGPIVAILSFVCSIGNVPLALILWNGGISFGGVVAFLFADLIILPIIDIYRKYYGARMAALLFGVFYVTMVAAALVVDIVVGWLGLVPAARDLATVDLAIKLDYTTILDVLFLLLTAFVLVRFVRTGGPAMLRRMRSAGHDHHEGHEAAH